MTGLLMSDWWNEQTAAGPEEPLASDMVVSKPALQLLAWQGNSRPTVPEVVRNRCQIALSFSIDVLFHPLGLWELYHCDHLKGNLWAKCVFFLVIMFLKKITCSVGQ